MEILALIATGFWTHFTPGSPNQFSITLVEPAVVLLEELTEDQCNYDGTCYVRKKVHHLEKTSSLQPRFVQYDRKGVWQIHAEAGIRIPE